MNKQSGRLTVFFVWLASFLFSLLVPTCYKSSIPENYARLIKEAFDTFGPSLSTMVTFMLLLPKPRVAASGQEHNGENQYADIIALTLAFVYAGAYDLLMIQFLIGKYTAEETVGLFQQLRPYFNMFVTALLVYYFGADKHSTTRSGKPSSRGVPQPASK